MAYNYTRDYLINMVFHNYKYDDLAGNGWNIVAGPDGKQISYDVYPSPSNPISELSYQTLWLGNAQTYLRCQRNQSITTGNYTICFWFKIDASSLGALDISNDRFLPGVQWNDGNGKDCKINLLQHIPDNNNELFLTVVIPGWKTYPVAYDYIQFDHWYHVAYCRCKDVDTVFIDGKKKYEIKVDLNKANKTNFNSFTIGNPYGMEVTGGFKYSYDEVCLCNDVLFTEDTDYPNIYISWLYPEVPVNVSDPIKKGLKQDSYSPNYFSSDKNRQDVVYDNIEITRPVYLVKRDEFISAMYNKHDFNDNGWAYSNFKSVDKLGYYPKRQY